MAVKVYKLSDRIIQIISRREQKSRTPIKCRENVNKVICARCKILIEINEWIVSKPTSGACSFKAKYYHKRCAKKIGII